jgi:CHAT domain-containing protein
MRPCLAKVVLQIIFFCTVAAFNVYGLPDSTALPDTLQQQLTTHRRHDDLESWIYARIAYAEAAPAAHIDFLMRTQQDVWRTYKNYQERLVWFDLLAIQGYYQLQIGNILSSISAYEAALEFYESYPLPDIDIIETVLKPLGNNYTRLADYNTALFIHQKTLALAQKKKDHPTIASVYSNMAICARWQGNLATATSHCQTGIRYANMQHTLYGLLLSTWADILAEQNRYDTAAIVCNKALQLLQRYRNDATSLWWYAGTLQIASKIALRQGRHQQATEYAKQALRILQQHYPSARQREKAKAHVLLGDIYYAMHQPAISLEHYQQALMLLIPGWKPTDIANFPSEDQLYSENTLADALNGKAAALQDRHQHREALQHYMACFMAERKLRKEFFYAESKLKELQVTRSRVEKAMKLAYQLYRTSNDKYFLDQLLLIAEVSRAQVLMDERQSRMQTTDSLTLTSKQLQNAIVYYQHELLNSTNKKLISTLLQGAEYDLSLLQKKQRLGDEQKSSMLTVPQLYNLFNKIPATVTVLEFFAGSDTSFIIELEKTGIKSIHCIPHGRPLHDTIQHFMQQWFANGPSHMINTPRLFYQACYTIYHTIFKNYSWKKERHYLLMPDGMFNYLPFDALVTEAAYRNNYRDWPYLCKQVMLSQAYSLQTWYAQQSARYAPASLTAFFVSKGKDAQQATLSIKEEYDAMRKQFSGHYYIDESATRQVFNQATDSTGLLHISTHAISSAVDPFPYLQLFDKPFYLFDLRYKRFSPSLVVLGACKTADGLLLEGEGVNSISRGFTAAGAGGVISGLWNVHDQAAIDMMQHFYRQLQQQHNPAMALHAAKQQWLQTEHENNFLQLPYYWAGFIYSGHLQKVQVTAARSYTMYYWLAVFLVCPPALYYIFKRKRRP